MAKFAAILARAGVAHRDSDQLLSMTSSFSRDLSRKDNTSYYLIATGKQA